MTPNALPDLLDAAADRRSTGLAVVDGDRSLSYGELADRANRLAGLLAECGVGTGDRVAIYLPKSLEAVVAIHGVMRAGAAYVPLDPNAPISRLAYIVNDCDVCAIVTTTEKAEGWAELCRAAPGLRGLVALDADPEQGMTPQAGVSVLGPTQLAAQQTTPPDLRITESDLAYILYTSGSTGQPKGVMLSHLNAMAFVRWGADQFGVGPDDRLSSHAPLHFDLSIFDLFAACSGAASVTLVPPGASLFPVKLRSFMEESRITIWYSVPSILSLLVERGGLAVGQLPELRAVLFAGEVFPTKYLRRLMSFLPGARFANLYGPTETNVCTWYEVEALGDGDEPVPIGKQISGDEVFIVGADGSRAAPGEVGELHVCGATVMQGYWGDPDRTARALVHDTPASGSGPAYRTGDLVQELPDGNLRFVGRRDNQIKSRGHRIELGDIEAAVFSHPAVDSCAAIAVPDPIVSNTIKLFAVVHDGTSPREIARHCAERLPRYMVPDTIELWEELPATSTGKLDRQALLATATATEEPT